MTLTWQHLMILGTILALVNSCAAIWLSTRTFRNQKLARDVQANAAEIADVIDKQEHLLKLYKKFAARTAQRSRRAKERENGLDDESTATTKGELRARYAGTLALNKRR